MGRQVTLVFVSRTCVHKCMRAGCNASGQVVTCSITSIPPGGSTNLTLLVRPTVPGTLTTSANVSAPGELNTTNNGPALGTLTVMQTCDHYYGDGSSYNCSAGYQFNSGYNASVPPSLTACCVSVALAMLWLPTLPATTVVC